MGLWSDFRNWLNEEPQHERQSELPDLATQIARIRANQVNPWRLPSIREALGVPSIQRAVALISNTTGMLAVQGYRNGQQLAETPRVVTRPDPFSTPRDFYRDAAYYLSTRGETVLWIASRDGDGLASALIVVPLPELTVEDNPRDRLRPIYRWGTLVSTRYSPATPEGQFVHITYFREPGTLRGMGPLQMCGAASSVSVEAQEWAANFFASGGYPPIIIKSALPLTETEAGDLKIQWSGTPSNQPKVIDPGIEDVTQLDVNAQGAQMLAARDYQNGDSARMFGIPGSLLDYSTAGSSLTYQNVEQEYTKFVRTCLKPNYLEPIEQALSDLLPRSTVVRFSTDVLLMADIKTRFDVYATAITAGVMTVEEARKREGFDPGDIENMPVLFAPPTSVPSALPNALIQTRSEDGEFRCDGQITRRRSGVMQVMRCNKLLTKDGPPPAGIMCPKCKKVYEAAA